MNRSNTLNRFNKIITNWTGSNKFLKSEPIQSDFYGLNRFKKISTYKNCWTVLTGSGNKTKLKPVQSGTDLKPIKSKTDSNRKILKNTFSHHFSSPPEIPPETPSFQFSERLNLHEENCKEKLSTKWSKTSNRKLAKLL